MDDFLGWSSTHDLYTLVDDYAVKNADKYASE